MRNRRSIWTTFVLSLLLAIMILAGCRQEKNGHVQNKAPADVRQQTNDQILERVKKAIVEYKLSQQSIENLSFEIVDGDEADTKLVNVRATQNKSYPGDPGVSPRLFSIRVKSQAGEMWTDALSKLGEFELISRKER